MTVSIELHSNVRKDGLQLIQIKISNGKERYRVSSEIYVKKGFFQPKAKWKEWIKAKHPDARELNNKLEKKINDQKNHYEKHNTINPLVASRGSNFFKYAEGFIEKYNNTKSEGTYDKYKSILKKLKDHSGEGLTFKDIDVAFIRNYITHLIGLGNKVNTYGTDLRKIKAIFNQAIKEDVAEFKQNPFLKLTIKTEKTKKQRLTLEELTKIRDIELTGYLLDARNIFLFCINCMGMRIGDAMRLKHTDISGERIMYSMNKTKDVIGIKINIELRKILNSYQNDIYIFPYIKKGDNEHKAIKTKTALVNKGIKRVAELAKVDKHISTHVSRHTWTQLAIDSGKANPRTIQKALGHESFSTTEQYINDLDFSDVNDLNDSIFE